MIYSKEALKNALYSAIKLIDFENEEYTGWLVPSPYKTDKYMLLPLNDIWNSYSFARSHIKKIYHLTNNVLIPKK